MDKAVINPTPSGAPEMAAATYRPSVGNPQSIEIHHAQLADVDWIIEELRAFSKFYGTKLSLFPSDDKAAKALITRLVSDHLFIVAKDQGNKPMGFISGYLTPHTFNPGIIVLSESFWWVKPMYRGSAAGKLLLEEFVKFGKSHADWVTMTLETHSPVSSRSILRHGFKPQEQTFLLETDGGLPSPL